MNEQRISADTSAFLDDSIVRSTIGPFAPLRLVSEEADQRYRDTADQCNISARRAPADSWMRRCDTRLGGASAGGESGRCPRPQKLLGLTI